MSCADCHTVSPEPVECAEADGPPILGYWFLVKEGDPVHAGIEDDGALGFRFAVWPYLEHPEPEAGEEILCPECFDKRYPVAEETEDTDTGDNDSWLSYP